MPKPRINLDERLMTGLGFGAFIIGSVMVIKYLYKSLVYMFALMMEALRMATIFAKEEKKSNGCA